MTRAQALEALVLLARSERQVCMATADCLIAAGLKVIEVARTDEALSYLECRADIHLVITEIDMPGGLGGLDLARFVIRRWPHIGIIVLGWPTHPTPSLPQAVTFLAQPCPSNSLAEQARAQLAAFPRPAGETQLR
ncbi:response regulator [Microvirga yunnanensis]|uniref:response regulator n=1 Tax=Microvirga yunnanensis TaxID=2953740 RepID=UPI0021CABC27|nr:response regulator [Microvirga sp. HBU65207]